MSNYLPKKNSEGFSPPINHIALLSSFNDCAGTGHVLDGRVQARPGHRGQQGGLSPGGSGKRGQGGPFLGGSGH